MKICTKCQTEKPVTEFYRTNNKKTGKTYLSGSCKACATARACERQKARLPEIRARRSARQGYFRDYKLQRKKQLRDWIKRFKSETACMDCQQTFPPECMDFDHRDPSKKTRGIASMIGAGQNLETIQGEIAKCDLVCANCHRVRTAKQLRWL